ncbi:MAG: hypothetical protein JWN85_4364 [Gammaproteobacteria bacterium]|nr:hypothetical protein [Gammaproteobacteria bacterium]
MMTKVIRTVALLAAVFGSAAPLTRAGDLGIGVTITGEITPGVYGRVDLSNRPAPPVVYAQPVFIDRPATTVYVQPIYLHVPPDHAKNWRRHCHEYHACNRPVYFVRSAEYDPGYRPDRDRSHEHREHEHEHEHDRHDYGYEHDHGHDHDRQYERDHEGDRDHGRENDHDRGHDHDGDRDQHEH